MERICKRSSIPFEWRIEDQALFDKLCPVVGGVTYPFPLPSLSPLERKRQRLAFRNERNLYHRTSSLSGRPIISMYSSDKQFPVYAKEEYWSDACEPRTYGVDFDFSRPFFEQLAGLKQRVPRVALISDPDADKNNCAYINCAGFSKNCYMAFNADQNEDSYYISSTFYSRDCVDCAHVQNSELCYECIGCVRCWEVRYSQDCTDCSSSAFLFACVGCSDCFCCANLIKRQYCIRNVQYSKEEYFAALKNLTLGSRRAVSRAWSAYEEFLSTQPRRFAQILRSENCTGDYIVDSKDCFDCYNIRECKDVRFGDIVHRATDCMDLSAFGVGVELVYNSTSIGVNSSRVYCSFACVMNSSDLFYCDECRQSQNCFGCVSLKRSSFCILNKQYSREEYFALIPRIVHHLRETGEWGEFFPYSLSSFCYNESVAQEKFPLTREEADAQGISWYLGENQTRRGAVKEESDVHDAIDASDEGITDTPLWCARLGKPFRITKAEYSYYKRHGIPLPVYSPDARYAAREGRRNRERLWARTCPETGEHFFTTYPPEFKAPVLSEKAFLALN